MQNVKGFVVMTLPLFGLFIYNKNIIFAMTFLVDVLKKRGITKLIKGGG